MTEETSYILNTFLFIFSGILVMWMAAGFSMLEAGLTRTKNNSTILLKNISLFSISCIMFYIVGYDIMYADGSSFMGYGYLMSHLSDDKHSGMSDFFFQVMFVATASSVISGTIAERMKLWPFLIFVIILSGIIYPIQGHWTWGETLTGEGGILQGFSDFAGSTIVHSVGGWAALAGVLLLGARKGKYSRNGQVRPIPGSSMPLATLGTFILWMGWFGFNGGSQLSMDSKTDINAIATVVVNTNMAAVFGGFIAALLTQIMYKKVDLTMVLNGILAGLVSVTAAPNQSPEYSAIVGIIGGILIVFAVPFFDKLKIDDPVGALSVHLVCGIWGTIAVGFTSASTILAQLKGVLLIGVFVFALSFLFWFILKITMGLRVSEEEEIEGLDISECGLVAYPEFKQN
ncbi:MAG TPA: ammonium transporter [Gammaproteobacteria bacterium]|nr:ammonium transporter [Gammaproteobacteria bacterium]HPQ88331.1 ammonium transporter [Gammaproteobacteria bacterium]